jgi:hypothetical protein
LYIATAAKLGRPVNVPKISTKWLQQFRKEKHISLRLPNKRWKIPKYLFLERNQVTWLNNIRLRHWIFLATGQEPECIDNVDQKPFHVNESGSKYQKTLAFKGGVVELVELHSATRERWTANTYGTSDEDRAMHCDVWLEMLMKGGCEILQKLQEGLQELRDSGSLGSLNGVTVATSPSGSYDTNDIVDYLQRALPEWGPGRRWRILLLDDFSAHKNDRITRLCWDRGYLPVYIGGGCTGALQPLDTHALPEPRPDYSDVNPDIVMATTASPPCHMQRVSGQHVHVGIGWHRGPPWQHRVPTVLARVQHERIALGSYGGSPGLLGREPFAFDISVLQGFDAAHAEKGVS